MFLLLRSGQPVSMPEPVGAVSLRQPRGGHVAALLCHQPDPPLPPEQPDHQDTGTVRITQVGKTVSEEKIELNSHLIVCTVYLYVRAYVCFFYKLQWNTLITNQKFLVKLFVISGDLLCQNNFP